MRQLHLILSRPVLQHVAVLTGRHALLARANHRSLRVAVLLAAMALLNLLDLVYTLFAHSIGELREMNPLASAFLECDLTASLVCYKILLVLAGAVMLWKLRESTWASGGCWILVLAYGALGVMWYLWVGNVLITLEVRAAFPFMK